MPNWLNSLLEYVRRRRAEQQNRSYWHFDEWPHLSISVGPKGIEIVNRSKHRIANTPYSIGWADFDRIVVYKRDRMTVDDICMAFEDDGLPVLEVSEDMKGWPTLVGALSEHLDGVMDAEAWYAKVIHVPFAPSTPVIYDARAQAERAC